MRTVGCTVAFMLLAGGWPGRPGLCSEGTVSDEEARAAFEESSTLTTHSVIGILRSATSGKPVRNRVVAPELKPSSDLKAIEARLGWHRNGAAKVELDKKERAAIYTKCLRRSARLRSLLAMMRLGEPGRLSPAMAGTEEGVAAVEGLEKAFEFGVPRAACVLGDLYREKVDAIEEDRNKNTRAALAWYKKAHAKGVSRASTCLGVYYACPRYLVESDSKFLATKQDHKQARKYFFAVLLLPEPGKRSSIAKYLDELEGGPGRSVAVNLVRGFLRKEKNRWSELIGDTAELPTEKGLPPQDEFDEKERPYFQWLRNHLETDPYAGVLQSIFELNRGDKEKARERILSLATPDRPLVVRYLSEWAGSYGIDSAQVQEKTFAAAEAGSLWAMTSLAVAKLEAGQTYEAVSWLRQAIARNDALAMVLLARLKADGIGVEKDLPGAMWLRERAFLSEQVGYEMRHRLAAALARYYDEIGPAHLALLWHYEAARMYLLHPESEPLEQRLNELYVGIKKAEEKEQ